eukprot:TRINITY_DN4077_c0_g1_i1.p1 TRINITY_DN4077_c0_g1~~TRINITY_DN4077_c0_g1_i1.p1  ORF type:complete len:325 (+),score=22.09 TRINITY_DN4077_c0_g1_i1:26-1000(+)
MSTLFQTFLYRVPILLAVLFLIKPKILAWPLSSVPTAPRLLLMVASGPHRLDRRLWMREFLLPHLPGMNARHWFFLDGHDRSSRAVARAENATYHDILTLTTKPGLRLGERLREEFRAIVQLNEPFDYLLVGDDDTFWCWPALSATLQNLADSWAYAGWPHCERHHFLDQHALILGRSLVHDIVSRYHDLKCSRYGGISLRHWQLAGLRSREKTTPYGNVALFHHRHQQVDLTEFACASRVTVHYVQHYTYWKALANNTLQYAYSGLVRPVDLKAARPCGKQPSHSVEHFEEFLRKSRPSAADKLQLCDDGVVNASDLPYLGGL